MPRELPASIPYCRTRLRLGLRRVLLALLTCASRVSGSPADHPHPVEPAVAAASQQVTPPRPLSDTAVVYPEGASGDASVELELVIQRDGSVQSAVVQSGLPPFADAARRAALEWRFEPARRGDQSISARIRFRVEFRQELPEQAPSTAPSPGAAHSTTLEPALPQAAPTIEVTVTGVTPVGSRSISRAFALQLPGAFGNPFAAIEASPGVTPTLSGAPYFYVRGSPPGNLGYLLDDMRLPALFHVLAGPSVVHPALVESVDFFAGPYPARYGRFTGGIAAGQIRPPSYELHGEASVRAFDSSGLVELPLAEHTSLTLSGRVSYANPIARLFAPDISVSYWDYQARLVHQLSARDELAVFAFGSHDTLDRENDEGERDVIFGAEFHRLQLRYRRQLDQGSVTSRQCSAGIAPRWRTVTPG
jgi:TonB family protein